MSALCHYRTLAHPIRSPLPQPELLVSRANEKFDTEGKLTDETTREHLRKFLEAFRAWTLQFKSSQS
jgi:hypothetical protein